MIVYNPLIQTIEIKNDHCVDVLRLDLLHPQVSGNKWFKLKLNLEKARAAGYSTILTFGGTHSNHIAATATACRLANFSCVGIIRGEETSLLNETLVHAKKEGMKLHFVARSYYDKKTESSFLATLQEKFGNCYVIPEGGHNREGIMGCCEIFPAESKYDYVFCACGTGTTFAGLVLSSHSSTVVGINVLKGKNSMPQEITKIMCDAFGMTSLTICSNLELDKEKIQAHCITDRYAFNGYAAYDERLIAFKSAFEKKHAIPLDYIYTNKLFYAVDDLISLNKLKSDSKILIVHSGGLQGNRAFENRYQLNPIR